MILSDTDIRRPDIILVHRSRASIVTRRGIDGIPDVVVETLSPGSRKRDKVDKMNTYAKYGLPDYWIVDPIARTLELWTLADGRYVPGSFFEGDDIVDSPSVPCLSFSLGDLFRDIPDFFLQ